MWTCTVPLEQGHNWPVWGFLEWQCHSQKWPRQTFPSDTGWNHPAGRCWSSASAIRSLMPVHPNLNLCNTIKTKPSLCQSRDHSMTLFNPTGQSTNQSIHQSIVLRKEADRSINWWNKKLINESSSPSISLMVNVALNHPHWLDGAFFRWT